ncbi:MAG: hypothetical protein IAI48_10825 [Candidatus Eremiobacteraeota bacterium]|nr:hypothetical protein [Candidatus Eremiobacteraeota bacterium]
MVPVAYQSPAPYREEAIAVPIARGRLSGTLTLPAGPGPFRVALVVAGSGPTDRNGNSALGVTVGTYEKLAHALAEENVATYGTTNAESGRARRANRRKICGSTTS